MVSHTPSSRVAFTGLLSLSAVLFIGCRGDKSDPSGDSAEPAPAFAWDTTPLPVAEAHATYTAPLRTVEAEGAVTYALTACSLPAGLVLNPSGYISGVPTAPGQADLTLTATNTDGETIDWQTTLEVAAPGDLLQCGESVSGRLDASAALDDGFDVDWTQTDGWAQLRIAVPPEGTEQLSIRVATPTGGTLWVGAAGVPPGHQNLDDYTFHYLYGVAPVTLHRDTTPSLDTLAELGQPLTVVFVPTAPTDWSLQVDCSTAPVIVGANAYPTELGGPLTANANLVGDNTDVTWSVEGSLPDWAVLDPTSGRIEGIAAEEGVYEYTLVAETSDGRRAESAASFAVYSPVDLPCNTTATLRHEEGYYSGSLYSFYDPRGYTVLRTEPPDSVSAVTYSVEGPDGIFAIVSPASSTPFYGSHAWAYLSPGSTETTHIGPTSERSLTEFLDADGHLGAVLTPFSPDVPYTVTAACDSAPRLARGGLPVVPLDSASSWNLPTVGGLPPITWSATGLPTGVALSIDGTLSADGTAEAGTYPVDLTLLDAAGTEVVRSHGLHVGAEAACGDAIRLMCGDTVEPELHSGSYSACVVHDQTAAQQLIFDVDHPSTATDGLTLRISQPGATPEEALDTFSIDYLYPAEHSAQVMRDGTPPDLDRWRTGPLFVELRAYGTSQPTLQLLCE